MSILSVTSSGLVESEVFRLGANGGNNFSSGESGQGNCFLNKDGLLIIGFISGLSVPRI